MPWLPSAHRAYIEELERQHAEAMDTLKNPAKDIFKYTALCEQIQERHRRRLQKLTDYHNLPWYRKLFTANPKIDD